MRVKKIADLEAVFAVTTGEPMRSVTEQHRCSRRELERLARMTPAELLENAPVREMGLDYTRNLFKEFERDEPTAFAVLLIGSLCDAPSRRLSGVRSWAFMLAPPRGERGEPLTNCPLTGARCFGGAIIHLLTDAQTFKAAASITVNGPRGFAIIANRDGRESHFMVGQPAGSAFDHKRRIKRVRSIDVSALGDVFNGIAGSGK